MYADAVHRLAAEEQPLVIRVDAPLGIVGNSRDDVDEVTAREKPLRRIGDERRNARRLGRIVRGPDEDPAQDITL
jgi:hypothetical protein